MRLSRLRDDESGMSFVFVGLGFLAFMAATTLAIDVGMMMTARSQAQNAADAGAHAGAVALAFNNFNDRSPSGPAVTSAINAAKSNTVIRGTVSITSADVSFPNDPFGQPTRVKVTVYRTAARQNAIPTLIAQLFGLNTIDMQATATAEASPANAMVCVLPFTVPDKWIENADGNCKPDGAWTPDLTFDIAASKGAKQNTGAPCAKPDVYVKPGSSAATGYSPTLDVGIEVTLKNNNQNKVAPSMYNPWDLPGSSGGNDYRDNIAGCNTNVIQVGDFLTPENGNMVGPTKDGVDLLVAKDPGAYWDTSCNCVKGSRYPGGSPRIGKVPLYDPYVYGIGQQTGKSQPDLQVTNYLGFFVEEADGSGNIRGRIAPIGGLVRGNGPATGAFARAIRLVQ